MERDTRETVDTEYHYLIFDILADSYNEGRITLDALTAMYHAMSGVEPLPSEPVE